MRRVLAIFFAVIMVVGVGSASAQSRTSYFMEGSYFRNNMNPALAPTRGYLALPISGIGVGINSNFLSVDNLFYQRDGGLVTALHGSVTPEEFLGRLSDVNLLGVDTEVNILSVGFHAGRTFWNFGVGANVNAQVSLSKDLFSFVKTLGNGTYDLASTAVDAQGYLNAYLGTSFPVCKWANVGIRAKFLVGIADAHVGFDQLTADVDSRSVVGTLRGNWRMNAIFLENQYVTPEGGYEVPQGYNMWDVNRMLQNMKSYGGAIDLGAEFRFFNDHLKVSAAVTDLGFIKWNAITNIGGQVNGGINFEGFDLEGDFAFDDWSFEPSASESYESYTSRLNCNLNVGVEYNILKNHIAFGLLSHTKFYKTTTLSELTASVNFRPTNWITATVSHTFLSGNRPGIFGAALNIHPAVLNIFVGMDYIDTNLVVGPKVGEMQLYLPRYAKSLNVYAGVGFNFGRAKYVREAAAQQRALRKAERNEQRQQSVK